MGDLADLVERPVDLVAQPRQLRVGRAGFRRQVLAQALEVHPDHDEPLLGAVVQVALDPAALVVRELRQATRLDAQAKLVFEVSRVEAEPDRRGGGVRAARGPRRGTRRRRSRRGSRFRPNEPRARHGRIPVPADACGSPPTPTHRSEPALRNASRRPGSPSDSAGHALQRRRRGESAQLRHHPGERDARERTGDDDRECERERDRDARGRQRPADRVEDVRVGSDQVVATP